jgi:hypothetical protein
MPNDSIMIVEDEILVAKNLQNILISDGYDVPCICDNGQEAIEKARDLNPTLVLMDIMIKGKHDGIDTADYLFSRLNIPVVFLTAYGDKNTLERAKSAEPYGYLIKPISDGILKTTIQMAIQKHKLETKVRENEELLSIIFNCIDMAVLVINNDLTVKYSNPAAEVLLSNKQSSIRGKYINDLVTLLASEKPVDINELIKNAKNKNEKYDLLSEYYLTKKDHNKIAVDGSIIPLHNEAGKSGGILLILRDISLNKKIESDILRFEKLESLSILAGGIAHDFNNMLTVLIGNLAFCRQKDLTPDELDKYLEESENACLRAKELTHQLMAFSKTGTLNIKTSSIKKILKSESSFIMHGSQINVEYKLPESLYMVDVDETQIEQVIQNILINAREAMFDGGTLTISAENISLKGESSLNSMFKMTPLKKGNYVKVTISDNGPGISKNNLKRIFDPYFTTKPNGTGLGLATAYNILKNHRGMITVESELGNGTSFTLYIPASENMDEVI